MPEFAYAGTIPRAYQETRDEDGVIVGAVSYGDTRHLEKPPDADWFPAGAPLPVRLPPGPEEAAQGASDGGGTGKPPAATPASGSTPPPRPQAATPATAATPSAGTTPAAGGQKAEG